MRTLKIEVPVEVILDLAQKLEELELDNSIIGTTENEEIEIEVQYEKEETKLVDELENFLEELRENLDEDEDDD